MISMKAVILPPEKSEDLNPLTRLVPEYLVPVVNKPIVEHLIELLVRNNTKEIILVVRHMPYEVEKYFGNGDRWGVEISYALEREFVGVSSILSHLRTKLEEEFLCISGNVVTNLNISQLIKAHYDNGGDLTLSRQSKGGSVDIVKSLCSLGDIDQCPLFILKPRALDSILPEKTALE